MISPGLHTVTTTNMNIINMGNNFLKDHILKQGYEEFYVEARERFDIKWEVDAKNTASKAEFHLLKELEMGQFGKAVLVQHKKNKTNYVMKMLDKDKILKSGYLEILLRQKRILHAATFPFICNLAHHFKDVEKVYMLYEYRNKSDATFSRLVRFEKCSEKLCRFYAAQIVLALEYLHHVGILYRDLIHHNILVDGKGYIRIRDVFGNPENTSKTSFLTIPFLHTISL